MMLAFATVVLLAAVARAEENWVGGRYMPRMGFRLMIGPDRVPALAVPLPFRVQRVSGDWLWVGRAWVRKSDVLPLDQAIEYYSQLIQQHPRSSWGYNCRGIAYREAGELDLALADYSSTLRLRPDSESALNNRGIVYRLQADYERSLRDFNEALSYRPGFSMALLNRASVYYHTGELARAHDDLNAVLAAEPNNTTALNNRGNVHAVLERFEEALRDYDRALALDPELAAAHNNRGWILSAAHAEAIRNGKEAVSAATRACELSNWQRPRHLQTLAAACSEAGDFESARKWQAKAVELLDSRPPLRDLARRRLEHYQSGKRIVDLLRRRMPAQEPPPADDAAEPVKPEGTGTLFEPPLDLEDDLPEILGTG
jgi:tetratricopeptide (TPR) repeat protein